MYKTIAAMEKANKKAGRYFFSPDTMAFFNSKVHGDLFPVRAGTFFITSERGPHQRERSYTVRFIDADGDVDSVSEFQEFDLYSDAVESARLSQRSAIADYLTA